MFNQVTYSWSILLFQTAFLLADRVLSIKTAQESRQGGWQGQAGTHTHHGFSKSVPQRPGGGEWLHLMLLQNRTSRSKMCSALRTHPAIFTPKPDVSTLMKAVQKIFSFFCFNVKQTQLKTLNATANWNRRSLDSWDRVTASYRAWKQALAENIPAARPHHLSFPLLSFIVSLHWGVHEH